MRSLVYYGYELFMNNILITGGTGSFGQSFVCRIFRHLHLLQNMHKDWKGRICIYSRNEHSQAEMRNYLGNNERLRFFIGDVRDRDRLRRAMESVDTVVHAAALKRIEVGRYNPIEMVKTNVLGAMNVIEAALDAGVEKVVALSTDKAYQPISPYGQSKALMESLFLAANYTSGSDSTQFGVTRYGNVAGSQGSVVPLWSHQKANNLQIKITDVECTRFWMTMDEAIDLVLNTIDTMPEEIAIPVLPAFQLGDLATAMGITDYTVTGLPVWEKKHEGLRDDLLSNEAPRMSVDDLKTALEDI